MSEETQSRTENSESVNLLTSKLLKGGFPGVLWQAAKTNPQAAKTNLQAAKTNPQAAKSIHRRQKQLAAP